MNYIYNKDFRKFYVNLYPNNLKSINYLLRLFYFKKLAFSYFGGFTELLLYLNEFPIPVITKCTKFIQYTLNMF